MSSMIARISPSPHEVRFRRFMPQQLTISGGEMAPFEPLPGIGDAQIAVETLHDCRHPEFYIAVEQMLVIE
jgi:hypothetical protein